MDADLQGRGIGSAMVAVYCARLDEVRATGDLETDKLSNVGFYRKFGFETVGEARVLGTPNWVMRRSVRI